MTPIALIPARGGSKRLPGKNLAEIGGVSLVARAVRCAVQVERFRHIIVSSDSQPILDEAFAESSDPRLILHERPPGLSSDSAGIEPLMALLMERFPEASHLVLLNPTSPFRRVETVRECLDQSDEDGWDTVATVFETVTPMLSWARPGRWSSNCTERDPEINYCQPFAYGRPRSQDIEPLLIEHGACYVVIRRNCQLGWLTGGVCHPVLTDDVEATDIDTHEDLARARGLYEWQRVEGVEL